MKQKEPTYFLEKKPMDLATSEYFEAPHCSKSQVNAALSKRSKPRRSKTKKRKKNNGGRNNATRNACVQRETTNTQCRMVVAKDMKSLPNPLRPDPSSGELHHMRKNLCKVEYSVCGAMAFKLECRIAHTNYAFCLSLATRLSPSEIIAKYPLKEVYNTTDLVRRILNESVRRSHTLYLACHVTKETIKMPCRSIRCTHPEVFELETFLKDAQYYLQWKCPVCRKLVKYQDLVLDAFLKQLSNEGKTTFVFHKQRVADKLNIPSWLVDLRNEATHSFCPSLSMLRMGADIALNYLEKTFWLHEVASAKAKTNLPCGHEEEITNLINQYKCLQFQLNIPSWLVDLRNEATHSFCPSLSMGPSTNQPAANQRRSAFASDN